MTFSLFTSYQRWRHSGDAYVIKSMPSSYVINNVIEDVIVSIAYISPLPPPILPSNNDVIVLITVVYSL